MTHDSKGKVVVSGLFLLLMMTTLVSQYAEAGALFSTLTGWPQPCVRMSAGKKWIGDDMG